MSPAVQRTLYRFMALFLAAGAGDAIVQFSVSGFYDWRHLAGALVVAAVLGLEKLLTENNTALASPTVKAVDVTLQTALNSPNINVPPPTLKLNDPAVLYTPPR